MSDQEGQEVRATTRPPWLDMPTLRVLVAERNRQVARGRDALAVAEAVSERLLALRPALPVPMIAEAVATIVQDAGPAAIAPPMPGAADRPAIVHAPRTGLLRRRQLFDRCPLLARQPEHVGHGSDTAASALEARLGVPRPEPVDGRA